MKVGHLCRASEAVRRIEGLKIARSRVSEASDLNLDERSWRLLQALNNDDNLALMAAMKEALLQNLDNMIVTTVEELKALGLSDAENLL